MRIVVCGHVDHGKSTVIGRMLVDTGSLPEGKLEGVQRQCARSSKPFEYAFLLDALKDEQSQGITIDAARVFFRSKKRDYVILDAPGHIEFLKNMITGASHADAALLVIDVGEGVCENSRRHGYMLAMLGIRQVAVLINKMDVVGYRQDAFDRVALEFNGFLSAIGVTPTCVIPIAAREGDNITARSERMPWSQGPSVLAALDGFADSRRPVDQPLRIPVQDVYKFTKDRDDRRIVAGTIESGALRIGDEIVFFPSGKRSRVKTIEAFNRPAQSEAHAGEAIGFTLTEQIYIVRGEVACRASDARPAVSTRLRASVFWLGSAPMVADREYMLRLGTAKTRCRLESVERILDASTLASHPYDDRIQRNDVAECTLRLQRPAAFDTAHELPMTGRFVIVDDYDIRGGGIVRSALDDAQENVRELVLLRNKHWEPGLIAAEERQTRYGQRPALLVVTGPRDGRRKEIAKALEARLFADGRLVYYVGFGSLRHGLDADLPTGKTPQLEAELMRRLGELAHILVDAGVILIVSAQSITSADLDVFLAALSPEQVEVIWVGDRPPSELPIGLAFGGERSDEQAVGSIVAFLAERGMFLEGTQVRKRP